MSKKTSPTLSSTGFRGRNFLSSQDFWAEVISQTAAPVVVAELSANHLGSLDRAKQLIESAKLSGADFVKFQHYTPETITVRSEHSDFQIGQGLVWQGRDLWSLYKEAMTPWEWTEELISACQENEISWLSSPFDETAVDFLEDFNPLAYKVASLEIVDIPLIERVADTGKPLILSTGMATELEISEAVDAALARGNRTLMLLRTNSAYPAQTDEMDLAAIPLIAEKWGFPVGLSDHTLSATSAVVATALGGKIFEKHLTLNRSDGGADSAFSLEPQEFKLYVESIREAFFAVGTTRLGPSSRELASLRFRPSIRVIRSIKAGELLSSKNIATVRPDGGLHPRFFRNVVGKRATETLEAGDPITWESIE